MTLHGVPDNLTWLWKVAVHTTRYRLNQAVACPIDRFFEAPIKRYVPSHCHRQSSKSDFCARGRSRPKHVSRPSLEVVRQYKATSYRYIGKTMKYYCHEHGNSRSKISNKAPLSHTKNSAKHFTNALKLRQLFPRLDRFILLRGFHELWRNS